MSRAFGRHPSSMKWFKCACGASVFFDNTACLACGSKLGFAPEMRRMLAFSAGNGDMESRLEGAGAPGTHGDIGEKHRLCANAAEGVCNWLVPESDPCPLCSACRLNETIPDLSVPENRAKWARLEAAKRRLLFTLMRLGLDVVPKSEAETGLAFDFKADTPTLKVFTGHDNGLITLNIAEADPVRREQARLSLNERYRTLLGHLRHESGHYYWDRLIRDDEVLLKEFRALFGDEQADYAEALKEHYSAADHRGWDGQFVSAYASSHPWEDWAETFAHFLHMVDTLETAESFGLRLPGGRPQSIGDFPTLFSRFIDLTIVLNALNRSMGLEDAYPFTIGDGAKSKLEFVYRVVSFASGKKPALEADTNVQTSGRDSTLKVEQLGPLSDLTDRTASVRRLGHSSAQNT